MFSVKKPNTDPIAPATADPDQLYAQLVQSVALQNASVTATFVSVSENKSAEDEERIKLASCQAEMRELKYFVPTLVLVHFVPAFFDDVGRNDKFFYCAWSLLFFFRKQLFLYFWWEYRVCKLMLIGKYVRVKLS